jgi:hypothetical protein
VPDEGLEAWCWKALADASEARPPVAYRPGTITHCAEEALVPLAIWKASEARRHPMPMAVVSLARALQVHPAIVAGRVRHEQRNYRLLSHFVGSGAVRRQLGLGG